MTKTYAINPPHEDCLNASARQFATPAQFIESQNNCRLNPMLREAAKTKNPWKILARAAAVFYRAQHLAMGPARQTDVELGNALADLAVTGRVAYARFQ